MKLGQLKTSDERMEAVKTVIRELNLWRPPEDLIRRLTQLDGTAHFSHSIAVAVGVHHVLRNIGQINVPDKNNRIRILDKREIGAGALFHDIGKTGPASLDFKGKRNPFVIVYGLAFGKEEFATIKKVKSAEKASPSNIELSTFLKFLVDRGYLTRGEAKLVFDQTEIVTHREGKDITLRDFYNAHTNWTSQILDRKDVHWDAKLAAGSHHAGRRFRFPSSGGRCSDEQVVGAGKWVEVVDSLQATTGRPERGRDLMSFEEAIGGIQRMVSRSAKLLIIIGARYHEFLDEKTAQELEGKLGNNVSKDEVIKNGLLEEAVAIANESVTIEPD